MKKYLVVGVLLASTVFYAFGRRPGDPGIIPNSENNTSYCEIICGDGNGNYIVWYEACLYKEDSDCFPSYCPSGDPCL